MVKCALGNDKCRADNDGRLRRELAFAVKLGEALPLAALQLIGARSGAGGVVSKPAQIHAQRRGCITIAVGDRNT